MLRVFAEVAFFIAFAWAMRRLLGVRHLSTLRTIVAALVGLAIGEVVRALLVNQGAESDLAATTGIVLALLFAMAATLTLESLSGSRRRGISSRRNPLTILRRRIDQSLRAIEIASIASRHGLGRGLGLVDAAELSTDDAAAYGAALRGALEEASGVFVKLGQVLATRTDLIPAALANELGALH